MIFDFDKFTNSVKLAYRQCNEPVYSVEEVLQVFQYYFEVYEYNLGKKHPALKLDQIARIIDKMPYIDEESGFDIEPNAYEDMIDQHFKTTYNGGKCDYNINHFFSGGIRKNRYYERCYM